MPEMTTARRWKRLVGASSSSWLRVGPEAGADPPRRILLNPGPFASRCCRLSCHAPLCHNI